MDNRCLGPKQGGQCTEDGSDKGADKRGVWRLRDAAHGQCLSVSANKLRHERCISFVRPCGTVVRHQTPNIYPVLNSRESSLILARHLGKETCNNDESKGTTFDSAAYQLSAIYVIQVCIRIITVWYSTRTISKQSKCFHLKPQANQKPIIHPRAST